MAARKAKTESTKELEAELERLGEPRNGSGLTSEKVHLHHHSERRKTACGRSIVSLVTVDRAEDLEADHCKQCIEKAKEFAHEYQVAADTHERQRRKVTDKRTLRTLSTADETEELAGG